MTRFLTDLVLRADPQPDMWVVSAPLVWCDPTFGTIRVPVGFRTDLASIPRAFRNLPFLDPAGQSRKPAAVHDWLYASNRRVGGKDYADGFLRAAMADQGASKVTAWAFWAAVHYFGGPSWRSDDGALGTVDFDTPANFCAWRAAMCPTPVKA